MVKIYIVIFCKPAKPKSVILEIKSVNFVYNILIVNLRTRTWSVNVNTFCLYFSFSFLSHRCCQYQSLHQSILIIGHVWCDDGWRSNLQTRSCQWNHHLSQNIPRFVKKFLSMSLSWHLLGFFQMASSRKCFYTPVGGYICLGVAKNRQFFLGVRWSTMLVRRGGVTAKKCYFFLWELYC